MTKPDQPDLPGIPGIWGASDYRDFLKARYWALKKSHKLSFQQFAKNHDASGSYLKLVLQKKRHIGIDKISAVSRFLKLTENEKSYLTFWALKAQSTDPEIRQYFDHVLTSLRFNQEVEHAGWVPKENLDTHQRKGIFGRVLAMIIEQMIDLPGYEHRAEWIRARLSDKKRYSIDDVRKEMRLLEKLGIIKKAGGQWKRAVDDWRHTPAFSPEEYKGFAAGAAAAFHAADHVMSSRPAYFELAALTLTQEEFDEYRALMHKLDKKITNLANSSAPGKMVFIASFGLFCAAKPLSSPGSSSRRIAS